MEEQLSEFQDRLGSQTIALWGEVAYFRFAVSTHDRTDLEDEFSAFAYQLQVSVEASAREVLRETLGSQFDIRLTQVYRSSVIAVFVLSAGPAVYVAVAQYPEFIRGLELLRNHIERGISAIWPSLTPQDSQYVDSNWTPGPALLLAHLSRSLQSSTEQMQRSVDRLRRLLWFVAGGTAISLLGVALLVYAMFFE